VDEIIIQMLVANWRRNSSVIRRKLSGGK